MCKPYLEKLAKDLNRIYQLFPRIPSNSYSRKGIKIWHQYFQRKHQSRSFTYLTLDAVSQQLYQKILHHGFFLWSLQIFIQERHKEQLLLNISVKQYYRGRVNIHKLQMNLEKKTTWSFRKALPQPTNIGPQDVP